MNPQLRQGEFGLMVKITLKISHTVGCATDWFQSIISIWITLLFIKLTESPNIDCSRPLPVVLPASKGQGLQISAQLTRQDGQVFYSMLLENNSQSLLDGFMIQFNKNSFGLAAVGPLQVIVAEYAIHPRLLVILDS